MFTLQRRTLFHQIKLFGINNSTLRDYHHSLKDLASIQRGKSITSASREPSSPSVIKPTPPEAKESRKIVIIGGGAAGLMAALSAQSMAIQQLRKKQVQQPIEIILLERKPQCGRKILMSGGSRCNVIPHESKWPLNNGEISDDLDLRYFTRKPSTLLQVLKTWPIEKQREFFEKELKIKLELEKESGKYFPETNDAKDVLNGFLNYISGKNTDRVKVTIQTNCDVQGLTTRDSKWTVSYSENGDVKHIHSEAIILSTGGLSVINEDGSGIKLLKQLGHDIVPLYPALTPLASNPEIKALHKELSGLTIPNVLVTVYRIENGEKQLVYQSRETKGFLFTHAGYSGPSVLNASHATIPGVTLSAAIHTHPSFDAHTSKSDISNLIHRGQSTEQLNVEVNWTPDISPREWQQKLLEAKEGGSKIILKNFIHKNSEPNFLPSRLVQLITDSVGLSDTPVSRLSTEQRNLIIERLVSYPLKVGGNLGFKKAEVTGGGVDLSQVHTNTLESNVQKNLFICGEALDVFGCIGGFNFAWAWISGRLAGMSSVQSLK